MRKILLLLIIFLCTSGCANLNPRLEEKIDNQNGQIDQIKNNQNGIALEMGQLRQQAEIQNSQLKEVQQGMLNINAAFNRNEGVQILQGDGPLVVVFGLGVIGMMLFYYRNKAAEHRKTSEILAAEIARQNDPSLNEAVFKAAMYTECESNVYHLLGKNNIKS